VTGANLPQAIAAPAMKKPGRGLWLIAAGGLLTVVWLGLLVTFVCLRWDKVVNLEPNAVGDFLAGAFAPLAFLWLVLGFFQQGIELRNSGEALWLQGEELRNSVHQQQELVATTREQLAFERDEAARQKQDLLRRVQPTFRLTYEGVISTAATSANHQFQLLNTGKDCFDVTMIIDSAGDTPLIQAGQFEKTVLSTGKWGRTAIWFEDGFCEDVVATVLYRDELNNHQVKQFTIKLGDGSVRVIDNGRQELSED